MSEKDNKRGRGLKATISTSVILLFLMIEGTGGLLFAQENPTSLFGGDEKIEISSDSLTVEHGSLYAEFLGNVKVTQGNAELKADSIKIHTHLQSGFCSITKMKKKIMKKIILDPNKGVVNGIGKI